MAKKEFEQGITSQDEDFSQWYIDTVLKAEMADYSCVRGCMNIRPYGYALWEHIRDAFDQRFKATGHQNAYFPMFVPESFLQKEAEHVEGFAPEVPWVTHVGEEKLTERLAIRPTSETVICAAYANWVKSYRDLPILINQWANVVRWEKRTRMFLRTSEFLWQEGHTCHRTEEEAREETMRMLRVYNECCENELAVPTVMGQKSESEKFAGAVDTYSIEAMLADGNALQAGTSHFLGQNFAKAFEIKFLDEDNIEKYVWQTSWGVSTRLVGAVIMSHGDNAGLIMPPRIAPIQVVIVPVYQEATKTLVLEEALKVEAELKAAGIRVKCDARETVRPGFKFNEWELKGVPLRIEIGPRDIEKGHVVVARRIDKEKAFVQRNELVPAISRALDVFHADLLARAKQRVSDLTSEAATLDELSAILSEKRGFVWAGWDGSSETEEKVKEATKATIRNIPLEGSEPTAGLKDLVSGQPAKYRVLFARAY
ncbi:MAG TPA: proline--tRNA ligase [Candidatus Sumerlaeota bacterium]|nr:proline--tRNA ligase [Candidatus Sumerlaeota bacterium]